MALKHAESHISEAEYLQGEMISDIKHEYVAGEVYAMAGASRNHNLIISNMVQRLTNHLQSGPCATFSSDLKIKAAGNFFYPDVMVVCGDEQGDDYYTDQPTLIVEVLSKTTRRTDKTLKLHTYKTLPSLQEYILIEQEHAEIEVFRRSANWLSEHYFLGDDVTLESVGLTVAVAGIYQRVDNEDMRDYQQQLQQQAL
jgi:Uma2 family endonuclease